MHKLYSQNHYLAEAEPDGEVLSSEGREDGGEGLLHVSRHLKEKEDQVRIPELFHAHNARRISEQGK